MRLKLKEKKKFTQSPTCEASYWLQVCAKKEIATDLQWGLMQGISVKRDWCHTEGRGGGRLGYERGGDARPLA